MVFLYVVGILVAHQAYYVTQGCGLQLYYPHNSGSHNISSHFHTRTVKINVAYTDNELLFTALRDQAILYKR
jgi:hypothetical protein